MKKNNLTSQFDPLIKKIEELDKIQRLLICVLTVVLLGVGYYFLLAAPMIKDIKKNESTYKSLEKKLGIAKKKAARLPALRKEREMKKAEFRMAMRELPEKREIPALLTSISQIGQTTGVTFSSFEPAKEKRLDFYAEIPMNLKMSGNFHDTIQFFDSITDMNRIVNVRNVKMKVSGRNGGITSSCQAVTYRFVEQKKGKKKKRKKKKRK